MQLKIITLTDPITGTTGDDLYALVKIEDKKTMELLQSFFNGLSDLNNPAQKPEKRKPAEERSRYDKRITLVDHGKIVALKEAGWSTVQIAEDMGLTEQTVRNHLRREK